tara:strand:+ start:322 stop:663 length:342 start_codon:yes stop_codon:yes gene_type:complete
MEMNNRQMAAAFRKIGFNKSRLQMTRIGTSYTYKDSGAVFTFPKGHKQNFQISAPGHEGWSCFIFSQEKWDAFQVNPHIDWEAFDINPTPMTALLCIAGGFAQYYDSLEAEEE